MSLKVRGLYHLYTKTKFTIKLIQKYNNRCNGNNTWKIYIHYITKRGTNYFVHKLEITFYVYQKRKKVKHNKIKEEAGLEH